MSVAHDATSFRSFSSSPSTTTHTPVGTPKGVVVLIAQDGVTADEVSGVTYGGVAMSRVRFDTDLTGALDLGASYLYFLGSGIPTGAQNLVVTCVNGSNTRAVGCCTVTASGDTEIAAHNGTGTTVANPSVTLGTSSGFAGEVYGVLYSGVADPASVTVGSGYSLMAGSVAGGHDFGAAVAVAERGSKSGASVVVNWTVVSDDVAFSAAAVQESAGGGGEAALQGVATASGISPTAHAAASAGVAPGAGVEPGARATASVGAAAAAGISPTESVTVTPTPGVATATGISPSSLVTLTPIPGVASASGISPTDGTLDTTPVPGVATGSGISPTSSTTTGTGAASGTGVSPLPSAVAGIGSATGQGIDAGSATVVSMSTITAAGIDAAAAALVEMGTAVGVGVTPGESTPDVIPGPVTAYSAAGSRVRAADPGTIHAASGGSV